jgi:asparagine synthase (glutamine-hydrolysing)
MGEFMSVLFGRWNVDGQAVTQEYDETVAKLLTPYGPDGAAAYAEGPILIRYHAFDTTRPSHSEDQPHTLPSGVILTWDGRLDNREELTRRLGNGRAVARSDISIVAETYERYGLACLPDLIGDWALSVWNPFDRSLLLARDFVGTRPLFYSRRTKCVAWSSVLEPLLTISNDPLRLDEEYLAGWLSSYPATHLTPYVGIYSVPPSSYVLLHEKTTLIKEYWRLNPAKKIRHTSDEEYEEHFRSVLTESVRRRLRSAGPILAELSGGMDSSSIVCVADRLLAAKDSNTHRLHTVSYFDDAETTWDERPYVTCVEEQRGCAGTHIDVGREQTLPGEYPRSPLSASPRSTVRLTAAFTKLTACLAATGSRIILSGIGGDEALGGVITPIPELADLLTGGHFLRLAKQGFAWALAQKRPLHHVVRDTLRPFLPFGLGSDTPYQSAPWLEPPFVNRHNQALGGYPSRLNVFGASPSFQANVQALDALRRQIGCTNSPNAFYEKRFPYLDRDLWELVSAIPRQQLVRPGERRSLMRRALNGIVLDEIRNRKRKAFVARGPMAALSIDWAALNQLSEHMLSSSLGIVNGCAFQYVLARARAGLELSAIPILRTLEIEYWLRHLQEQTVCRISDFERTRLRPTEYPVPAGLVSES